MHRRGPLYPMNWFKTRCGDLCVGISVLGLLLASPPALAISSRTLIAPTGAAAGDLFGNSVDLSSSCEMTPQISLSRIPSRAFRCPFQ